MVVKGYYILSLLFLSCIPTTTNQMSTFELRDTMIERMWVPAKAIQTSKSIPDVPRVPAQNSHLTAPGRTAVNPPINQSSSRHQASRLRCWGRARGGWRCGCSISCSRRPVCYRAITPPPGNQVSRAGEAARRVQSHATCPAIQTKSLLQTPNHISSPLRHGCGPELVLWDDGSLLC